MYEKQLLRELEALRPDVNNAAKKVMPQANGIPRPSVIPPLEDFSRPPAPRSASVFPSNSSLTGHGPPSATLPYGRPAPQTANPATSSFARQPPSGPLTPGVAPPSQTYTRQGPLPPQSPGAGPSTSPGPITFAPPPEDEGPPLGGKFVDGTKSMFVKPPTTPSPLGPTTPSTASQFTPTVHSPLHSNPLGRSTTMPSVEAAPRGPNGRSMQSDGLDPLGQARPSYMSQSVRVMPTRQRLDAREAASKLANMF